MNTRFHCIVPAQSTASWRANSASWRVPVFIQDRAEALCSSRYPSMSEPPISTARPRGSELGDRRDARVDLVGAGRAFAIRDVAAGAQALTLMPDPSRAGAAVRRQDRGSRMARWRAAAKVYWSLRKTNAATWNKNSQTAQAVRAPDRIIRGAPAIRVHCF